MTTEELISTFQFVVEWTNIDEGRPPSIRRIRDGLSFPIDQPLAALERLRLVRRSGQRRELTALGWHVAKGLFS